MFLFLLHQQSFNLKIVSLVLITLFITGCGGEYPKAQFVANKRTKSLIPEARTGKINDKTDLMGIDDYMAELFGTPENIVAWRRLPVNFGGIQGKVTEVKGEGLFVVHFDEQIESFAKPQQAYWMAAKSEDQGKEFTIASYDLVAGEITISTELETAPEVGELFILHPGKKIKQGYYLYMQHCLHCHGTSGDGAGPTAKYLTPRPRDFRHGKFKFKATTGTNKIRRDGLARTIKQGIPGTYMPSFLLLEDDELKAIIEYVRWLAMRGEFERAIAVELATDYSKESLKSMLKTEKDSAKKEKLQNEVMTELIEALSSSFPEKVNSTSQLLSKNWQSIETDPSLILIPQSAQPHYKSGSQANKDSLERGKKMFKETCANCHGPQGRGDGANTEKIQMNKFASPPVPYEHPGFYDDWGHRIKPRDLTSGVYRGGRRPIDIYRRIRGGIPGTPMPAATKMTDAQIWDTVNYIMSLPYNHN